MVANRASVLAAARRVFLAKGYAGATLEAIAEEAGFSKGVVYSQFGGKADLFLALLDARIDERAAQNEQSQPLPAPAGAPPRCCPCCTNFDRDAHVEAGWARVLIEFRSVAMRDPELNRRYAAEPCPDARAARRPRRAGLRRGWDRDARLSPHAGRVHPCFRRRCWRSSGPPTPTRSLRPT